MIITVLFLYIYHTIVDISQKSFYIIDVKAFEYCKWWNICKPCFIEIECAVFCV